MKLASPKKMLNKNVIMQVQMLITIAQTSTNKAQSEEVGCGGAFNLGRASFLEMLKKYKEIYFLLISALLA